MDLMIGDTIIREALDAFREVDPYQQAEIDGMFRLQQTLPATIDSLERILAATALEVEIPAGYVGMIGLRSTWARLGLVAPTTFADPGFVGTLTMELFNSSNYDLLLRPGDYIWHMVLAAAPHEPLYTGRYQGQQGITLPKAFPKRVTSRSGE